MKENKASNAYQLRSGATILPEQDKEFDRLITHLMHNMPATFILMVDVAGQVVTVKGEYGRTNLVMLGSLVAGDLAASQEIARLTGEYQDYQVVLREGHASHIFIAEAGMHLALFVQVSNDVPLGWARMLLVKTAQQIAEIMDSAQEDHSTEPLLVFEEDESADDLSDLFSDALDELWME